jgi:hypothetical protein
VLPQRKQQKRNSSLRKRKPCRRNILPESASEGKVAAANLCEDKSGDGGGGIECEHNELRVLKKKRHLHVMC